jgi:hypothetical protein
MPRGAIAQKEQTPAAGPCLRQSIPGFWDTWALAPAPSSLGVRAYERQLAHIKFGDCDAIALAALESDLRACWQVTGTLFYGGAYPDSASFSGSGALPDSESLADDFHTYTLEWNLTSMRW